jgi:hypothetical protein
VRVGFSALFYDSAVRFPASSRPSSRGINLSSTLNKTVDNMVLLCYKGPGSSQSLSAGLALLSRLQARPEIGPVSDDNSALNN